jgi:hypothetical protein
MKSGTLPKMEGARREDKIPTIDKTKYILEGKQSDLKVAE